MKCQKCESRPATHFAIYNGKVVRTCRRHINAIEKDAAIAWMRIPKVRKEG